MQNTTRKKKEMRPMRAKLKMRIVGFRSLMTFSMPSRIKGDTATTLTVLGKPTMKLR